MASNRKFSVPINLLSLASDPASADEGDVYYNTTDDRVRVYKNSTWVNLAYADDVGIVSTDYITFDTTPEATIPATQGTLSWDSGESGLNLTANSNVDLHLGQQNVVLVKNATGASIPKGSVVYINGAAGQRPTIALSDADTEATSSKTLGLTAETIADAAEGFVTTFGVQRGVNTLGMTEGAAVWLSSTAGAFTTTIPAEPAHSVFVGYVVKAHASAGEVFVNPQNGYELTELHGVTIDGTPADNELLAYDTSSGLWINQTPTEAGLDSIYARLNAANSFTVGGHSITAVGSTALSLYAQPSYSALNWYNRNGSLRGGIDEWGIPFVGSAGNGGNFNVRAFSAAEIPVAIRGAASQTANLTEWQNSAGTVLSRIDSTGSPVFPTTYSAWGRFGNWGINPGAVLNVSIDATTRVGFAIRGVSGQTAALQEWQSFDGTTATTQSWMTNSGELRAPAFGNRATYLNSMIYPYDSGTLIYTGQAANVGLRVQNANAAPTADLQQWISNATTVAKVNNIGRIEVPYASVGGLSGLANVRFLINPSAAEVGAVIRASASQTGNLQEWQDSSGNILGLVSASGRLSIRGTSVTAALNVYTAGTSTVGAIIAGVPSQTGDLTQWQNSSGTVIAGVSAAGFGFFGLTGASAGQVSIQPSSTSTVGLMVRGAASQTGDLLKLQASTATDVLRIDPSGRVSILAGSADVMGTANATFAMNTHAAGAIGMVVRGVASQTANLQEWQDSTGTVRSRVDSIGNIVIESGRVLYPATTSTYITALGGGMGVIGTSTSTVTMSVRGAASQTADLQQWQNSAGTVGFRVSANPNRLAFDAASTAGINIGSTEIWRFDGSTPRGSMFTAFGADYKGLVIRGVASQTAAVFEVQDSSANAHLTVAPTLTTVNTNFRATAAAGFGSASAFISNSIVATQASNAAYIPLLVKGAASQTANLQEWQNSSGTILASIGSGGTLTVGSTGTLISAITGRAIIVNNDTAAVVLTTKGAAAQTANLQEWQNNAGTILRRVASSGQEYLNSSLVNGLDTYAEAGSFNSALIPNEIWADKVRFRQGTYETSTDGSTGWTAGTFDSSVVDGRQDTVVNLPTSSLGHRWTWNSSDIGWSTVAVARISTAYISPTTTYDLTIESSADGVTWTSRHSSTGNSGYIGRRLFTVTNWSGDTYVRVTIKHNSAATAIRLEGIELLSYRPGDQGGAVTGMEANIPFAWTGNKTVVFQPTLSTSNGIIVRGATSQSANLVEVQNSSNTVLASISSVGNTQVPILGVGGTALATLSGTLRVMNSGAAAVGITVRGAASQTANLQEWQNSAGTILTRIDSTGSIKSSLGLDIQAASTINGTIYTTGLGSTADYSTAISIGAGRTVTINATAASVPLTVKAAASQTANLQEWQDSAGAVLGLVTSAGLFESPRFTAKPTGGTYGLYAIAQGATAVPIVAKGAASQTANLQEWQNSAGSILAKMASDGQLFATNLSTINSRGRIIEYSNGAYIQLLKSTVTANPGANILNMAVRDGTTADTLKLVVRAGAAGVETPIVDNINQTGTNTSLLAVAFIDGGSA